MHARIAVCLIAVCALHRAAAEDPGPASDVVTIETLTPAADASVDPLALLEQAARRCQQQIRGYHCTFRKQERLAGQLKTAQRVDVRYRAQPRSVYMHFREGIDEVRRCAWVAGRDRDGHGQERARVEPAGAVLRLVCSEVKIPIRGEQARAASRHFIDDFGFHAVLQRLIADTRRFGPDVRWEHGGTGSVDGRPTRILVRHLPYEGVGGRFPDALMIVHLDAEWLAPVLIESYADPRRATLLGRYATTSVQLNPTLTDDAFDL